MIAGESDRLSPLTVPTRRSPVQALQIVENLARVLPTDGLDIGQTILAQYDRLPRDAALIRTTDLLRIYRMRSITTKLPSRSLATTI